MMTNARIHTYADDSDLPEYGYAMELDRISVSFPAEDGYEDTCRHCGDTIAEYADGWNDSNGLPYCESNVIGEDELGDDISGPHEPETGPGTWCNSAAISVDDEHDEVTVTISVGDPRGAFAMTVRKVDRSGYCKLCGRSITLMPTTPDGLGKVGLVHAHVTTGAVPCDPSATWDPNTNNAIPDGERLMLHVPDPSDGWLHMPLTKLHDGTYLIGRA